ncbi:uncharacterized protein LOC120284004 [Dioscorea cayenensis subsp. rotundata]|uniref:Uncharacterized protein LOC120284004 n=1 Tax=Dioscorea cayennensis subsp. rotundata TaxID=55577 RepID=A0AB40D2W7_DIOCR|nr:uncharacterized protein LOC120284004 [Dioscorea cayenensis subsp. rotundata]
MDNPNIICWNCRGISSKATSDRVRFLIRSHRPKIICLVETRANADRTYRFCSKISKNWEWAAILADGFSGGIIVLWDKFLGYVTPIAVSRRDLHLVISTNNSFNWVISTQLSTDPNTMEGLFIITHGFGLPGAIIKPGAPVVGLVLTDYVEACSISPNGSPLHSFGHLLSRLRSKIVSWSLTGLTPLDRAIKETESTIKLLEETVDFDPESNCSLSELYSRFASLQFQNSARWAQRAHLLWLKDGDNNTSFFHNSVHIRSHFNVISQIYDSNDSFVTNQADIESRFVGFYSNLWRDNTYINFLDVYNALPHDLPTLTDIDGIILTKDVSRDEVFSALNELPSRKSPGPDGFNAEFYKFFWPVLGDRLFEAIRREQVGFVSGRCTFDNILALQEIVHSLEHSMNDPPRMLTKIDIEKAYDTLSWSAILATLAKMNFPNTWNSWIAACLKSSSFSILINGSPSSWITSTRGIRQGDPISSYLFILVSQNLSSLLIRSMNLGMIPGFDARLSYNFNHLMYADDLVIVTRASRFAARNIKLCLDFYASLTGQKANASKSSIYLPSWFNSRVARSIKDILCFPIASFPLLYLGVLISPSKLNVSHFKPLVDRINRTCARWKNLKLSLAAKSTLINSSLLAIPTYYLSVYPIPDSILKDITKIIRNFFWHKSGNGKGIHAVSWSRITDQKTEGGLAIRIYQTAYVLKPFCGIKSVNPSITSFLFDPWCGEIPLAFKPTFLNMHSDLDLLVCNDLCIGNSWNYDYLYNIFGSHIDDLIPIMSIIDHTCNNKWVWIPKPFSPKITSTVYHFLNNIGSEPSPWAGWRKIWSLRVMPRVKHFLWLLFNGRLATADFLYSINLGPRRMCILCNLDFENSEHLFHTCCKTQGLWAFISNLLHKQIHFPDGFVMGNWLCIKWGVSAAFSKNGKQKEED